MAARIIPFEPLFQAATVAHILSVENGEFGLALTVDEQPDLRDIQRSYIGGGGHFWLALSDAGAVVGTLGLFDLGGGDADLRKMFVRPDHRGGSPSLAQRMLDELLDWSRTAGFRRIFLETNSRFTAAIRLYERNGFQRIDASMLPPSFPVIRVAEHFYRLDLGSG